MERRLGVLHIYMNIHRVRGHGSRGVNSFDRTPSGNAETADAVACSMGLVQPTSRVCG